MSASIALQLYTVRDLLPTDFEGVVRQVAAMGYAGVETAGFPGATPQAAARLFNELGLKVCSAHTPLPTGGRRSEVQDTLGILGCKRFIAGLGPDAFRTLDDIQRSIATFQEANEFAKVNDLLFGIHNHWWEYLKVEGRYAYKFLLEQLDPSIFFELDTYWIKTAGCDPAAVTAEFGPRAPYLHIKDGPAVKDQPMTAIGTGVVDFPAILAAGQPHTQWLIVELDRTATPILPVLQQSINYLKNIRT
jgi:sugar phosphate isomerase/epimerase